MAAPEHLILVEHDVEGHATGWVTAHPDLPQVRVTDVAATRGDGVFETISIGSGHPQALGAHLERFARSARMLDLPATREWLETYGIPVLGWQWGKMAAFYSRNSDLAIDERVETGSDVAEIAEARDELGLKNAILVTVPVPEQFEIEAGELEELLSDAVHLASEL